MAEVKENVAIAILRNRREINERAIDRYEDEVRRAHEGASAALEEIAECRRAIKEIDAALALVAGGQTNG